MKKEYIHYGHEHFNKELFIPVTGTDTVTNKPKAKSGLWGSPVDAEWGWMSWCEGNYYKTEKYEACNFKFTLVNGSKVFHIRDIRDVYKLPMIKQLIPPDEIDIISGLGWCYNWAKIAKEYDAVELHYSEMYPLSHEIFYSWDVDSIIVLNPEIVREVEE